MNEADIERMTPAIKDLFAPLRVAVEAVTEMRTGTVTDWVEDDQGKRVPVDREFEVPEVIGLALKIDLPPSNPQKAFLDGPELTARMKAWRDQVRAEQAATWGGA